MTNESWNYIIVGAGAAGCVVANRLSANGAQVLLLEAGGSDEGDNIHDPGGFVQLWGSEVDWKVGTSAQPQLTNREILINQGKVIGGSTSLNAMMWVRGNQGNFDEWAARGATGWDSKSLLPYFQKVEDYTGQGAADVHGTGGPMSVQDNPDEHSRSEPFMNGCVEMGYDGPYWDINGARQENGAGLLQFSITKDGKRASAAQAYLDPARGRENLTVETGAQATKILFEGTRAVGVEYLQGGETKQARTEGEVIVCGGAFFSPQLLMLSGIGPAAHLQEMGITVVADVPGVGQNLQDHLQLPVVFTSKHDRELPTLLTGNTMFINTRKERPDAVPDLQVNFTPAVPKPLAPVLNIPIPVGIFLPILIMPDSIGEVKLRSANPLDLPIINPNYLHAEADMQTLRDAVKIIRELAKTSAMSAEYETEIVPGEDADLDAYIRGGATTIWHPAGTCAIGSAKNSVVDPQLRVRGVENLRVADASVMPTVTSGNTQAACFVIGEKAADAILQQ